VVLPTDCLSSRYSDSPPVLLFFSCPAHPLDLPSFPTRRSSDLRARAAPAPRGCRPPAPRSRRNGCRCRACREEPGSDRARRHSRSEEHTSELQSLTNLVCRLLLENKNLLLATILCSSHNY